MEKMIYKSVSGIDLNVDAFLPETESDGPYPALALFHGGGWAFGKPDEFHEACKRYAAKGVAAFSFQYRLSVNEDGTFPHPDITPVESTKDARSALRWLKSQAGEFNLDINRIAAGGQSAGGQLAMATVLNDINEDTDDSDIDPAPGALLLFSSNVNTVEQWVDNLLGERREEIWSFSSYHNLKQNMPPVLQFHGREDSMVPPYAVDFFAAKMKELGNVHELHWFEGRSHYLGEGLEKYATYFDEEILELTDDFLIRNGIMKDTSV